MSNNRQFQILAISGSLRLHSSNTELLRAVVTVAQPAAKVVIYDGLGKLPHFNPDLDVEGVELPPSVSAL